MAKETRYLEDLQRIDRQYGQWRNKSTPLQIPLLEH